MRGSPSPMTGGKTPLRRDLTFNALSSPTAPCSTTSTGRRDLAAGGCVSSASPGSGCAKTGCGRCFFRFFAHYGRGAPDPAALAACQGSAPELPAPGRTGAPELLRLLEAPGGGRGLGADAGPRHSGVPAARGARGGTAAPPDRPGGRTSPGRRRADWCAAGGPAAGGRRAGADGGPAPGAAVQSGAGISWSA